MVNFADTKLGEVVDLIRLRKLYNETLLVFSTDNVRSHSLHMHWLTYTSNACTERIRCMVGIKSMRARTA